ncbi:MAG: periplasmic heavy metal sensor [Pseudomonadota bacterium]
MNISHFAARPLLAAAFVLLCAGARAQPMLGHDMPPQGPPPMDHSGPGGHGPGMPSLHGLDLSEAQQDKVFAIMHAQQPQRRELEKSAHKAHEALHALAGSGQFDEAKAAALAQAAGQAMAALALQQARMEAQIAALLTPEQRKKAEAAHPPQRAHEGQR